MDPITLALAAAVAMGFAVVGGRAAAGNAGASSSPAEGVGPDGQPLGIPDPTLTRPAPDAAAGYVCEADTLRWQAARKIGVPFIKMVPVQWDTYDCQKKLEVYAYMMVRMAFYAEAAALLLLADPEIARKSWREIQNAAAHVTGGLGTTFGGLVNAVSSAIGGATKAAASTAQHATDQVTSTNTSAGGGHVTVAGHRIF